MELYLTDIHGKHTEKVSFSQIKDAYLELFRQKSSGKDNVVSISNASEEMLEIYSQSVVFTDLGGFVYDGPGGAGELLSIRYEEGTILPLLEEICNLLEGSSAEKIISLLKKLPKPKDQK